MQVRPSRHTSVPAEPAHLPGAPLDLLAAGDTMTLGPDVLGVVLEYVDSLDKATPRRYDDSDSVGEGTISSTRADPALRGGAECRCVSRSWRVSVEEVLSRSLPPMSSRSLAALLVPGRLHFILLSCRYLGQHEHAAATAFAAVASRAEAVGLLLYESAAATGRAVTTTAVPIAPAPTEALEAQAAGVPAPLMQTRGMATEVDELPSPCDGGKTAGRTGNKKYGDLCCRVALKRIVEEALDSPAFSWCSSLGVDDSRLIEGCVGASSLLHARWFGGSS